MAKLDANLKGDGVWKNIEGDLDVRNYVSKFAYGAKN